MMMSFNECFHWLILIMSVFACSCKMSSQNCENRIEHDIVFLPIFGVEQTYDMNKINLQYREGGHNHSLTVEVKTCAPCLTNKILSIRVRFDDDRWKSLTDDNERKKLIAILRKASTSDYFDAYAIAWNFFFDKMREYYIYTNSNSQKDMFVTKSNNSVCLSASESAKIEYMDGFQQYITSIGLSKPARTRTVALAILQQLEVYDREGVKPLDK